ncbi:mechanosensitive ion channel family protein [Desulfopila sp. IMCC35008]|uniref:mechanosensitive ion channel family protein n=1 Tax=Desulfopila sp. IMCC35008 TaxID=2653858 RepID=UPI0013D339B5|nr:mechanosensitive ion channel domain-containing protein [Desulfopila sp. IMCC35008]
MNSGNIDFSSIDYSDLLQLGIPWSGKIVSALLVFWIGKWLAKKIARLFVKILERNNVDVTLTKFLYNILYYIIIVAVVIAAAGQLGVNTTSFLTVVGAASLAIGLALKDSLGNFASGVMLILFRPFKVSDVVTVGGETGKVEEITIFNTILNTADNQRKIIPNSIISSGVITNITANPVRRIDLIVGIGYDDDIRAAKKELENILAAEDRVLKDPASTVAVSELGASSVDLAVRPWVKTEEYWDVRFDLVEKIKMTFDEKGISFPYPQTDVHLFKQEEAA